ncbi:Phasin [Pseudoruegeria sp. HB172150]|uniref:Phasin n=1 Tax=Pseudoruegeria sp. HB172150 TaxID=2721164 RepID=UPI0015531F1D|nr:Phasin [Pseudoruegeria sp. HB172150]
MPTKTKADTTTAALDMSTLVEQFRTSAELGEKLAKVALQAAERSNDLSTKWAKETIAELGSVASAKDEPSAYAQAAGTFFSSQGTLASENLMAFAEIARSVQEQTIEIMLNAGKAAAEDAADAMNKATGSK